MFGLRDAARREVRDDAGARAGEQRGGVDGLVVARHHGRVADLQRDHVERAERRARAAARPRRGAGREQHSTSPRRGAHETSGHVCMYPGPARSMPPVRPRAELRVARRLAAMNPVDRRVMTAVFVAAFAVCALLTKSHVTRLERRLAHRGGRRAHREQDVRDRRLAVRRELGRQDPVPRPALLRQTAAAYAARRRRRAARRAARHHAAAHARHGDLPRHAAHRRRVVRRPAAATRTRSSGCSDSARASPPRWPR